MQVQTQPKPVKLSNETIQSLAIGKIFKDNTGPINSLDFSDSGKLLVTSSDDESLNLYDTEAGSRLKFCFSKKYGCDLVRFTHANSCVLVASKVTKLKILIFRMDGMILFVI